MLIGCLGKLLGPPACCGLGSMLTAQVLLQHTLLIDALAWPLTTLSTLLSCVEVFGLSGLVAGRLKAFWRRSWRPTTKSKMQTAQSISPVFTPTFTPASCDLPFVAKTRSIFNG